MYFPPINPVLDQNATSTKIRTIFYVLPYHLANEEPNDLFKYMKMVPLGYYGAQTLLLPSDMVSVLMQAKQLLTYRTCSYV